MVLRGTGYHVGYHPKGGFTHLVPINPRYALAGTQYAPNGGQGLRTEQVRTQLVRSEVRTPEGGNEARTDQREGSH